MKNRRDTMNRCISRLLTAVALLCTAQPAAASAPLNTPSIAKELSLREERPLPIASPVPEALPNPGEEHLPEGCSAPNEFLPPIEPSVQDEHTSTTDTSVTNTPRQVEITFGTDVMSSYVCRGSYLAGASFQPSLDISYGGLIFAVWGSIDFTASQMMEVDLSIGYRYRTFEVRVTDYYVAPLGTGNGRFFKFGQSGPHSFELSLAWTPSRRVPIGIWWGTTFAGADVANDGRRNFSSYAEISYPFSVRKVIDMKTGVGFMPWSTENCFNTYGFAVTNVYLHASKQWSLRNNMRLGILARLICNPYREQLNFVGGVSLYI